MERESEAFVEEALDAMYEQAEKEGVAPVFLTDGHDFGYWDEYDQVTCPFCGQMAHPEICDEERNAGG